MQKSPQRNCLFYLSDEDHYAARLQALRERKTFSAWLSEVVRERLTREETKLDVQPSPEVLRAVE